MKRDIIKIDEELCDGCGLCIPNCHEGALQVIDGKVRLISDLMCDRLGACVGHCPQGAISIENREAREYDEVLVMQEMVKKGANTVTAHLQHLKDHNETTFLREGVDFLMNNSEKIDFDIEPVIQKVFVDAPKSGCKTGECPGSAGRVFEKENSISEIQSEKFSELTHWPVQLHLINPAAAHFRNADLVIAADCTAFSYGTFHSDYLKGKKLVIACPKLDSNLEIYQQKIYQLIEETKVNTITVIVMEVPCCGGLLKIVKSSALLASRKVPIKAIVISIQGAVLSEEWI